MVLVVIALALVLTAGLLVKLRSSLAKWAHEAELRRIEEVVDTTKRHLAYEAQRAEEAMRQAAMRGWPR